MNDKQFQALLDKAVKSAVKSAVKHRQLMDQVGQECIERYGYHYSDLDIDCVIDAVDNGLGFISVDPFFERYNREADQAKCIHHKSLSRMPSLSDKNPPPQLIESLR